MKFGKRLVVIGGVPLIALSIILASQNALPGLDGEASSRVATSHRFFWFVAAGYIANYIIAFKAPSTLSITMGRMLIWAVVAYIAFSNALDIFLNHRELSKQILAVEPVAVGPQITELRLRAGAHMASVVLALVCIGVGLEPGEGKD